MDSLMEIGQQLLAKQGFSNLLGTRLTRLTKGEVELELPMRPELRQQYGFAHGGVLSYLADNALTFAGGTAMLDVPIITSEFKINYVRPALGHQLVARARAVHTGRRQSVCQCEIFAVDDQGETLVAVAQGTIVVMGSSKES
ncbi:PaaI family thioesterase [Myxococcus sp. AB025B]|uniref:PaaI family thioesterase n=1 Tax=Myxococcus sp. AB025B TaxID=2562794 RepID=UPI001E5BDF6A|nr:PaaI family thioesterase [Myxococcus sp. AB025B]